MRPTFRKLEVKDIGNLERLVADNIDGVEPGLKVVDSRLLLGQAAIDLVGLDSKDSLVLIALDFSADDGLLLRVMDAYSGVSSTRTRSAVSTRWRRQRPGRRAFCSSSRR